MNAKKGFTLLEMLAVLFIIAAIFAIVAPSFGPMMGGANLNTAAENLANTLESARQHAMTMGTDTYVVFYQQDANSQYEYKTMRDENGNLVTIDKWQSLPRGIDIDGSCSFLQRPPNPITIDIDYPNDGDQNPQPVRYVRFKPNGAAFIAGNRTIRLVNSNGDLWGIIFYDVPRMVES